LVSDQLLSLNINSQGSITDIYRGYCTSKFYCSKWEQCIKIVRV